MEHMFEHFFAWFGTPSVGLPEVFISAFISATLIPSGSEAILFGYITINPHLFWVAIMVATVGNTLGGMFDWWLGMIASILHHDVCWIGLYNVEPLSSHLAVGRCFICL